MPTVATNLRLLKRKPARRVVTKGERDRERVILALIDEVTQLGVSVRREELKRGLGWRAASGGCRKLTERILFVDRRLPLLEQEMFLRDAINYLRANSISNSSDEGSSSAAGSNCGQKGQLVSGGSDGGSP